MENKREKMLTNSKNNAAIIVAGGLGHRMNSNLPKQFMNLGGKPVVQWSLECFNNVDSVKKIILVLPEEWLDEGKKYIKNFIPTKEFSITIGGKLRQDSVWNGLNQLNNDFDFVAVHDAARPGLTIELVNEGFKTANEKGNAIFAVPSYDTLAIVENSEIIDNADRNKVFRIQTPQIFTYKILKEALENAKKQNIVGTDEASLVRKLGYKVYITLGSERISKITTSEDLETAEFLLNKRK
ncbi:MAG: 2-C-methyl-D-erythritol 4-phosphate cytidylyltransferase [Candidatus Riflebacteria bacterium]|nr:2-C-methyl-D-erythritol 4-phosphate cytidylyltransferase [Candidatus Riflebacteria bacterium]